jgi:hypothetical protein
VDSPTEIHGVPYHWTCLPLRMAPLRIAKDPSTTTARQPSLT